MSHDLLETVVERLRTSPHGTCEKVGQATGLFPGNVRKLKQGRIKDPRWSTLKPIAEFFGLLAAPGPSQQSEGAAK